MEASDGLVMQKPQNRASGAVWGGFAQRRGELRYERLNARFIVSGAPDPWFRLYLTSGMPSCN